MEESIINFNKQFDWTPKVEGEARAWQGEDIIVGGMGGSHLSAGLLKLDTPDMPIFTHKDYALPPKKNIENCAVVASSYSGNTEETVDFLNSAIHRGLKPLAIASGGTVIEIAEKKGLGRVKMPSDVIQPRVALGYSLLSLCAVLGMRETMGRLQSVGSKISPVESREEGEALADKLFRQTVLVYASSKNKEISYNWKIKINETAKIPAFANVLPEMNHNEIAGFDKSKGYPKFDAAAVFITDDTDSDRVKKRMKITRDILVEHGVESFEIPLVGESPIERALRSLVLADWTSLFLARLCGVDTDTVPVIADLKRRMAA